MFDVCQRHVLAEWKVKIKLPPPPPHVPNLESIVAFYSTSTRISQSVEKTETRCNTPTGCAPLIATKTVCLCVCVCVCVCVFVWQGRTFQSTKVTFTVPSACKYWKICDRACHWSKVNVISSVPMALCTGLLSKVRQRVSSSGNKYKCVWRH